LQPAIKNILEKAQIFIHNIDAIAVTNGPGSYTGLRVGLSSAKGLCFALNKPLITLNTLNVMAFAALQSVEIENNETLLFCPMIDARRMEVFVALYNNNIQEILPVTAMILTENSFENELQHHPIVFSGSGAKKCKEIIKNSNAIFSSNQYTARDMVALSITKYVANDFANVAYTTPNYGKEFYTTATIKPTI
jgi:tRNA threonylcarbamoyladenosine biosynthesis protein TsaB